MSITPDGNTLLGATRNPNLTVLSLPSLSPTGATYKTGQLSAVAVTSSPDGDGVAVAVDGSGIPTPYDLNLYATGDATPLTSWTNGGGSFDVAYNEDGSKLFLLGQDANGNHVTFATTPTHVGDVSITASTSTITDGG